MRGTSWITTFGVIKHPLLEVSVLFWLYTFSGIGKFNIVNGITITFGRSVPLMNLPFWIHTLRKRNEEELDTHTSFT